MINKLQLNILLKKIIYPLIKPFIIPLLIVFVFLYIIINLSTKRTAEEPENSNDSKNNESFISGYKLLDSIIYIKNDKYIINEVWSAFVIASYKNIFVRSDVEMFSPQFILKIDNGYAFSFKNKGYKFIFSEFPNNSPTIISTDASDFYLYTYKIDENDLNRLKIQDTVQFYLLNPQDSILGRFTMVKI